MLLEVYKCVKLNRCSVVCGCVLQGDWTDAGELGGEWAGESGEDWTGELVCVKVFLVLVLVLDWTHMSPARSSASHAEGSHDWLPKKTGGRASGEAG